MQIIWYNSELRKYQFGNVEEFKTTQSRFKSQNSLTVLMELPQGDQNLANKVTRELNVENVEHNMTF